MTQSDVQIILASPRGFCAGVERAVEIVEKALIKYGAPIYIRHEIVHNKYVVDSLRQKGAVFVEELSEIPDNAFAIFSAHGVSDAVEDEARLRKLSVIDATCPLVTKVHLEAKRQEAANKQIIMIGHRGHPEVEGTSGRVKSEVLLVSSIEDIDGLKVIDPANLAYVTQTTLSVDDTARIIAKLKEKFPQIIGPDLRDICYATQNRQNAVKEMAKKVDVILVIGAKNSSNSSRLRDLGQEMNIPSYLIDTPADIDLNWLAHAKLIGITAGASAPEILVDNVINYLRTLYNNTIVNTLDGIVENVKFKLPKEVR